MNIFVTVQLHMSFDFRFFSYFFFVSALLQIKIAVADSRRGTKRRCEAKLDVRLVISDDE